MNIIKTTLNDCLLIEPKVYGDERGFFLETYQEKKYREIIGNEFSFVQDNHSRSSYGVLRGLHFQKNNPQGKLVRVVSGKVFDVVVDLRKDSTSYANWYGVELSEKNKKQLWVPAGFAHGFVVLSEVADFEYKCTDYYNPDDEHCLIWNDETLQIKWPIASPILSSKDLLGKKFSELS
tara:strand:+ start:81 stop:614 length:534 start_codon:yes stop_codon:yes gene_type:complete